MTNGKNIFLFGKIQLKIKKILLVEQGYVWIDNPFEDWYDDIQPILMKGG